MGADPNVYSALPPEREPSPRLALTIGEMVARKWQVRAVCDRCAIYVWVDPKPLVAMIGPHAFFWGRRGSCKVMMGLNRCSGRTRFEAKTIKGEAWRSLDDNLATARHLFQLRNKGA